MQNAINEWVEVMNMYPQVYSLEIIDEDCLVLKWTTTTLHSKEFKSAIHVLEWMEQNLEQKPIK